MKFEPLAIPGVIRVVPDVHGDERGFFLESYHEQKYAEGGIPGPFVQDNHSRSANGILRGLHAQLDPAQGKLVRVLSGEILDVAVDVRRGSPHFGQHVAVPLSGENFHQLWVPEGFLHGFCVLSERADVEYKVTAPYTPESEIAVAWNDPDLAIPWPVSEPRLSARDQAAPRLTEIEGRLPTFR